MPCGFSWRMVSFKARAAFPNLKWCGMKNEEHVDTNKLQTASRQSLPLVRWISIAAPFGASRYPKGSRSIRPAVAGVMCKSLLETSGSAKVSLVEGIMQYWRGNYKKATNCSLRAQDWSPYLLKIASFKGLGLSLFKDWAELSRAFPLMAEAIKCTIYPGSSIPM